MEHEREEESREMFSPNDSGESTQCDDAVSFTVQGFRDALMAAESTVTEPPHPEDKFIHLEVMMVDRPRQPCPPAFSWNGSMVQHVLKSDPALRELEHVQVDSPGLAYLFFYDRHGDQGLMKVAALAMHSHIADAFVEWIGRSAPFDVVPLLLEEGCQHATTAQERCRQCIRPQEQPTLPIHSMRSASSGSLQLVGRVPPVPEAQEVIAEHETPRVNVARPHRQQTKA